MYMCFEPHKLLPTLPSIVKSSHEAMPIILHSQSQIADESVAIWPVQILVEGAREATVSGAAAIFTQLESLWREMTSALSRVWTESALLAGSSKLDRRTLIRSLSFCTAAAEVAEVSWKRAAGFLFLFC